VEIVDNSLTPLEYTYWSTMSFGTSSYGRLNALTNCTQVAHKPRVGLEAKRVCRFPYLCRRCCLQGIWRWCDLERVQWGKDRLGVELCFYTAELSCQRQPETPNDLILLASGNFFWKTRLHEAKKKRDFSTIKSSSTCQALIMCWSTILLHFLLDSIRLIKIHC